MTGRSRKLNEIPIENTEKSFDELIKTASESEKPPVEEVIGAKEGVFTPFEPKKEEKIVNKPIERPKNVAEEPKIVEKPSVEAELKAILAVPKGKRAVPSLITFYSTRSNAYRHVIVDIVDSVMLDAWEKYKELCPNPDEEEFMGIVYKLTNTDIPRMYRAVGPVTLKK